MNKHTLTDLEKHECTTEDRSNRKGKTFGENSATKKAIKELQPKAFFLTKEEWKKEMQKEGMSYFKIQKYSELLTFAKYSKQAQQTTRVNESYLISEIQSLKTQVTQQTKLIEKLFALLETRNDLAEPEKPEESVQVSTDGYVPKKMDEKKKADLLKRLNAGLKDPCNLEVFKQHEQMKNQKGEQI